jgi:hypothetical protein
MPRDNAPDDKQGDERPKAGQQQPTRTPGSDMQPDDAGTPASGVRGNAAEPAMKQASKTGNEPGSAA